MMNRSTHSPNPTESTVVEVSQPRILHYILRVFRAFRAFRDSAQPASSAIQPQPAPSAPSKIQNQTPR